MSDQSGAPRPVFTVLFLDGTGGWVMGAFDTLNEARKAIEAHEDLSITWEPPSANKNYLRGTTKRGDRYIIASVQMGRIDV